MTNLNTTQLTALNRAIAEYCGWKYRGELNGRSIWQEREDTSCVPPSYITDLNAIVEVVREWCGENRYRRALISYNLGYMTIGFFLTDKKPALALCLAFAKAAELKGEWDE